MQVFPKQGIIAALRLPYDENHILKRDALGAHLSWLRGKGIHGILVNGSTGCFPMLSVKERIEVIDAVLELAGALPVIVNISDLDPRNIMELAHFAKRREVAAVAIMPPIFYPSKAQDQLAHFEKTAAAADRPVMLYNFPELTTNRIGIETVRSFAERAPMVGIKQSGGEFGYHEDLIAAGKDHGFAVYSGADLRLPEIFKMGAAGCIGGLVNMVPELMVEQFHVYKEGMEGTLEPTASRMQQVGEIINRETFPANVSVGMLARGLDPGVNPTILAKATENSLREMVVELAALFSSWGLEPANAH